MLTVLSILLLAAMVVGIGVVAVDNAARARAWREIAIERRWNYEASRRPPLESKGVQQRLTIQREHPGGKNGEEV